MPIDERFPQRGTGKRPLGGLRRRRQFRIRKHHADVVAHEVLQGRNLLRVPRLNGQHDVLSGKRQDFGDQPLSAGFGHERFLARQVEIDPIRCDADSAQQTARAIRLDANINAVLLLVLGTSLLDRLQEPRGTV